MLYEVTQSPQRERSAAHVLGPTVGVRERTSNGVDTLVFRKDTPNGGAYVTSDPRVVAELKELPQGLIITEPSTPSGIDDGSHRPGRTPDGADGTRLSGLDEHSRDPIHMRDQADSRNGSMPPPHPAASFLQRTNSGSPGDAVLEGIPGNMFDWGKCLYMHRMSPSNVFERWLGSMAPKPRV